MTCALQQMDAAASKAPRSDLHSLALVFKEIAEAYQLPPFVAQQHVGMMLNYTAINQHLGEFADVKAAFLSPDIYPQPEPDMLTILEEGYRVQFELFNHRSPVITQQASDSRKVWRFLIKNSELTFKPNMNERWVVSPGWDCNAKGSPNLATKPGYVVFPGYEGTLVIGTTDGMQESMREIDGDQTHMQFGSDICAVFFIANDDLDCRYGAGFGDNHGSISITI